MAVVFADGCGCVGAIASARLTRSRACCSASGSVFCRSSGNSWVSSASAWSRTDCRNSLNLAVNSALLTSIFSRVARTSLASFSSSIRLCATSSPPGALRVSGRTIISSAVSWRASISRRLSKYCWRSGPAAESTSSSSPRTCWCWLIRNSITSVASSLRPSRTSVIVVLPVGSGGARRLLRRSGLQPLALRLDGVLRVVGGGHAGLEDAPAGHRGADEHQRPTDAAEHRPPPAGDRRRRAAGEQLLAALHVAAALAFG